MAVIRGVRSRFQNVILLASVIVLSSYFGYVQYAHNFAYSRPSYGGLGFFDSSPAPLSSNSNLSPSSTTYTKPGSEQVVAPSNTPPEPPNEDPDVNVTLLEQVPDYIRAILNPEDKTFPRLECPFSHADRYTYLKSPPNTNMSARPPKYYFALNLYQCVDLLPRLIGSIIETIKFLGPENCVLSIVEGRSDDGTYEVLKQLRASMDLLKIHYVFERSDLNPKQDYEDKKDRRIETLAKLRNLALKHLVQNPNAYAPDTTVIFINDISVCMEDILELIHQRAFQKADQTCAMDWIYLGGDTPSFYDVWIARGMSGDLFFEIPPDSSWDQSWNLFWNDTRAHERYEKTLPIQVFSCWNGITAFTAKPFMEKTIEFRSHKEGSECFQGEPKLLAKDLWYHGFGKIAVIPSVNVGYNDDAGKKIKELKGYASKYYENEGDDVKIEWDLKPPDMVKCMPTHSSQRFLPWDEGLPNNVTGT